MAESILERLGLVKPKASAEPKTAVPEILAIADRLEGLEPGRAQFVALFAIVLARTARADLEFSDDERQTIEQILCDLLELPVEQAELVGEMVAQRSKIFGVSTDYIATRELVDTTTIGQREAILQWLFAVCASDDSISLVEEAEVRQIAGELGLDSEQVEAAKKKILDPGENQEAAGSFDSPPSLRSSLAPALPPRVRSG